MVFIAEAEPTEIPLALIMSACMHVHTHTYLDLACMPQAYLSCGLVASKLHVSLYMYMPCMKGAYISLTKE